MNPIAQELRSRINPLYASQIGTESYERRVCAEEIERLEDEKAELLAALRQAVCAVAYAAEQDNIFDNVYKKIDAAIARAAGEKP